MQRRLIAYSDSEKYYTAIKDDPELHVKLTGSWETIVGEQDTFCEIPSVIGMVSS